MTHGCMLEQLSTACPHVDRTRENMGLVKSCENYLIECITPISRRRMIYFSGNYFVHETENSTP